MKKIFVLMLCLGLYGCVTPLSGELEKIKIGMTREELVKAVGKPRAIKAQGNVEYLTYFKDGSHFVRLINGVVEAFGVWGDFDSIKDPTLKVKTEENIKAQSDAVVVKDLYYELEKLKKLRDEGIISKEEFEKEKKKLLDKY